MKRRITLNTFRYLERAEESLIRASMPRVAALDQTPLESNIRPAVPHRVWRLGKPVQPLTYKLQDVA